MAAADERDGRNFRQSYYEKVGFKGVPEKQSIEMILNERPLDVNRLVHFTCRFNLPDLHRERVWHLLLGCPPSDETITFVEKERKLLTCDLEEALCVMNLYSGKKEQRGRILTLMYLLEKGELQPGFAEKQLEGCRPLLSIAHNLSSQLNPHFKNDYLLLKEFMKVLLGINRTEVRDMVRAELAMEEPLLYDHLQATDSLRLVPCDQWLASCFAGFIAHSSLIKLWDKIVAGITSKVMSLTGKHLIRFWKDDLFAATDAAAVEAILLRELPPNKSEALVKEVFNQLQDL